MTVTRSNSERLKAYREKAVAAGKCYVCRARPVRPGYRLCQHCTDIVKAQKATWKARRACESCGARANGKALCMSCAFRSARHRESINWSEWAIEHCKLCHVPRESANRTLCNRCLDRARSHHNKKAGRRCRVCGKPNCWWKLHTRGDREVVEPQNVAELP